MATSPYPRGVQRASTIRDVAALANVSKSTASRVVLGQSGVSPKAVDKVRKAVVELDFVPNQIARSLSVRSPAILGLFLRYSASPFYAHLAEAFEEHAGNCGYEVLSVASGDQPDKANYRSLMVLAGLQTAGIVVAAPTIDPATIRQVASRVPLVLVGQMGQAESPDVPFTAPDPAQGEVLIDHLVALGHTSIALVAHPPERAPTQWARIARMRDVLEVRGLLARLVITDPSTGLTQVIEELHRAGTTAVLCNDDATALDAIAAARQLGLSVPSDLSIAGHDGIPPFDHETLGLTTYRVPVFEMAGAAVDFVSRLIRQEQVSEPGVLLKGELIVGRTTGPVPAVAAAMQARVS